MPIEMIEREIHAAHAGLAESAVLARHCHERYLDDLAGLRVHDDEADPLGSVTVLTRAYPWALAATTPRPGTATSPT